MCVSNTLDWMERNLQSPLKAGIKALTLRLVENSEHIETLFCTLAEYRLQVSHTLITFFNLLFFSVYPFYLFLFHFFIFYFPNTYFVKQCFFSTFPVSCLETTLNDCIRIQHINSAEMFVLKEYQLSHQLESCGCYC